MHICMKNKHLEASRESFFVAGSLEMPFFLPYVTSDIWIGTIYKTYDETM